MKFKNNLDNISFSSVPEWLRHIPEYIPWETGKEKVWNQVSELYLSSAPRLFDSKPALLSETDDLAVRLLVCWLYHWQTAGTSKKGADVVKSVVSGQGFAGNGQLGGNPFFDLVFAQALCFFQDKATIFFQDEYLPYLRQIAKRVEKCARFDDDIPCWWGPFYMSLTGTASEKAKATLYAYRGFSGIRNWLRISLGLFLRRFVQKESGREIDESELGSGSDYGSGDIPTLIDNTPSSQSSEPEEDWNSLREHFTAALREARQLLSGEEWTRLYYHFGAKLQNQQIARLYNENGSTTTRHRDAALLKFRRGLMTAIAANPVLRDLGDSIFSDWGKEAGDLIQTFFKTEGASEAYDGKSE